MNSAYHALVTVRADCEAVHDRIMEWLSDSKFRVEIQSRKSRIVALYPGWHGFGITDAQTASELEVLLKDLGDKTAVSFYHHTRRFFIFTGAMCGHILETEVENLIGFLEQKYEIT